MISYRKTCGKDVCLRISRKKIVHCMWGELAEDTAPHEHLLNTAAMATLNTPRRYSSTEVRI